MLIYCICTQYLVGAPFALITASILRGMEVISLWYGSTGCGMWYTEVVWKPRFLWQWPSASDISLLIILCIIVYVTNKAHLSLICICKCTNISWYMAALTVDFRKHSGPTPADDMAAQIITDCGNFTLDFKQHGFSASPLFLQTLGPWFPCCLLVLTAIKWA